MTARAHQKGPSLKTVQAPEPNKAGSPEPPPDVIFAWVNWVINRHYVRTGQWVMPDQLNFQKYLFEAESLMYTAKDFQQNPLPGLNLQTVPDELHETKHRHTRSSQRTGFNYRQSPFWAAAGQLLDNQAARPVAGDLRFGCQHVLSLILAWLQFPLFNAGGRSGQWMTLGCDRICKELRVTSRNVLSYLYELEHCGIIFPGKLSTGLISRQEYDELKADVAGMDELLTDMPGIERATSFLHQRCVQLKSTFYRLKAGVARPSLPDFNPFAESIEAETLEKGVGRTWETPQKDVQGQIWQQTWEKRTSGTSFPRPHDSDYEYEHEYEARLKEEKDLIRDMNPAQQALFTFLRDIHTSFPGSTSTPISETAAARLAQEHSQPAVEAALAKVKRDWAKNGPVIESPIALFISEIPKQAAKLAQASTWTRSAKNNNRVNFNSSKNSKTESFIPFQHYYDGGGREYDIHPGRRENCSVCRAE